MIIMNKRKIAIDLLVILIAFILFFQWYNYFNKGIRSTSVPFSQNQHYKIYLITIDKMDQYWDSLNEGATDMAELLGVTYTWVAPETKDTKQQIELINNAVNNGADVIMIAANDPRRTSAAIEDAKARGIMIIYVDTPANEEAVVTLATNNHDAGQLAGTTMLSEIGPNVQSGSIGIIDVNMETASTVEREIGFREVIEQDGRFTLLNTVYLNGNPIVSEEVSTNFILENEDLVGLFATNEGSTVGVGKAIQTNNKDVVGIGFDKSDTILELLNDGSLKAILVQNPYTMGYLGVAEAYATLKGFDTGPTFIDTGISVMRKQ